MARRFLKKERELLLEQRGAENRVFFSDCVIRWKLPLNPKEFEALCLDILEREPSVRRAKPVGTTYNHDGGRDILIELLVPKPTRRKRRYRKQVLIKRWAKICRDEFDSSNRTSQIPEKASGKGRCFRILEIR